MDIYAKRTRHSVALPAGRRCVVGRGHPGGLQSRGAPHPLRPLLRLPRSRRRQGPQGRPAPRRIRRRDNKTEKWQHRGRAGRRRKERAGATNPQRGGGGRDATAGAAPAPVSAGEGNSDPMGEAGSKVRPSLGVRQPAGPPGAERVRLILAQGPARRVYRARRFPERPKPFPACRPRHAPPPRFVRTDRLATDDRRDRRLRGGHRRQRL